MSVHLIAWSDIDAVAIVDDIRVRIRRSPNGIRWLCDVHGEQIDAPDLCPHTQALADSPADPAKHKPRPHRGRRTRKKETARV